VGKQRNSTLDRLTNLTFIPISKSRSSLSKNLVLRSPKLQGNSTASLYSVISASSIVLIKSDFSTNGIPFEIPYASMYSRRERIDMLVNISAGIRSTKEE
jgi:hypothetical protein